MKVHKTTTGTMKVQRQQHVLIDIFKALTGIHKYAQNTQEAFRNMT